MNDPVKERQVMERFQRRRRVMIMMMVPLLLGVASFGMSAVAMAETVPSFDLTVPPLVRDQPTLHSIYLWNKSIVVEGRDYDHSAQHRTHRHYVADQETQRLRPLVIPSCKTIYSLAESVEVVWVFCADERPKLLSKSATRDTSGWDTEQLPEGLPAEDCRLVVTPHTVLAFVCAKEIYLRNAGTEWQRHALTLPVDVAWHADLLFTNESLFLGWDGGEFGGELLEVPIKARSAHPVGPSKVLRKMNVQGMLIDKAGKVWVAGGGVHLNVRDAELVTVQDGIVKTIINDEFIYNYFSYQNERASSVGSLRLPDASWLSGVCLAPTGKIHILATELGIFEVSETQLSPRIKTNSGGGKCGPPLWG